MIGIIKKFELKQFESKDGKKFKKLIATVDVKLNDRGDIKTVKGSFSEDYARKYFKYCGVTTKDLVGQNVDVSLAKRAYTDDEGNERQVTYAKFINVLDENGHAIIMPKDDATTIDF